MPAEPQGHEVGVSDWACVFITCWFVWKCGHTGGSEECVIRGRCICVLSWAAVRDVHTVFFVLLSHVLSMFASLVIVLTFFLLLQSSICYFFFPQIKALPTPNLTPPPPPLLQLYKNTKRGNYVWLPSSTKNRKCFSSRMVCGLMLYLGLQGLQVFYFQKNVKVHFMLIRFSWAALFKIKSQGGL